MMTANTKRKLHSGQISLGAWLYLNSPSAAELMARAGFDWLIIDGEHGAASWDAVQAQLQAMNGSPTVPMLRVAWNDPVLVKVALDIGVKGIMFPMIRTRAEAEAAVAACKYPPAGIRGIGPGRASLYGQDRDYLARANDDLLIFMIIEHYQAVENIDAILATPGLDAAFFGYADFAGSLGLTGQLDHPAVIEARDKVLAAARRAGVAAGYAARDGAHAQELAALGFTCISVGHDAAYIAQGARAALAAAR